MIKFITQAQLMAKDIAPLYVCYMKENYGEVEKFLSLDSLMFRETYILV